MIENATGDLFRLESKTRQARNWRGELDLPVGDESLTVGYRMLTEDEMGRLITSLPMDDAEEFEDEQSDDYERLMDLQDRDPDDLSDDEQAEIRELRDRVRTERGNVVDEFGEDALGEIMWAGMKAVKPTEEDIEDVWHADPSVQEDVLGAIPSDKDDVEASLTARAENAIDSQPYPLKIRVGMRAMMETKQAWGNGLDI